MQGKLEQQGRGIQRLWAIIFENSLADRSKFNLTNYRIPKTAFIWDKWTYEKLFWGNCWTCSKQSIFTKCNRINLRGQRSKTWYHTRLALLPFTSCIEDNVQSHIYIIFDTLRAIPELLYMTDDKRTSESVLALYGKVFLHRILLRKQFSHKVNNWLSKNYIENASFHFFLIVLMKTNC